MGRDAEYWVDSRRFDYQKCEVMVSIRKKGCAEIIEKSAQELFYGSDWLEKFNAKDIRMIALCIIDLTIKHELDQLNKLKLETRQH